MVATEVVDHILGYLHSDQDYISLKKCSEVFPDIVDRHLYSQITLNVPLPQFTSDKRTYVLDHTEFSRILIDRPHVANYVRGVQIKLSFGQHSTDWLRRAPVVLESISKSILPNLPRIESIMLKASRSILWHNLGLEFCMAFRNSLQLPSIEQVVISKINDFSLDTFDDCKKLKTLSLLDCGELINGENASTSSFPRLRSLCVNSQPHLTRIISWMKNNTLHTLSLHINSSGLLPNFQPLIEICSSTLVNLEVNHVDCCYDFTPTFSELRLPLLEHLTFHSHICMPNRGVLNFSLSLLETFVTSIKTISIISPIRLTLHFQLRLLQHTSTHDLDWSEVAAFLVLPIFRRPIDLYISQMDTYRWQKSRDAVSSCEQNFVMKRLVEEGQLAIIMGAPDS